MLIVVWHCRQSSPPAPPAGHRVDEVARCLISFSGALLQSVRKPLQSRVWESWGLPVSGWRYLLILGRARDGDIHLVVVLIDDADHLLIAASVGYPDESANLSDAEIHMHDGSPDSISATPSS